MGLRSPSERRVGHGRKPTGRAWVSVAVVGGSWAPSSWGLLAHCGSWLKGGPPARVWEMGYLSTTSFPSLAACCSRGPLTPWHPGLFLLQKQAWDRAAGIVRFRLGWERRDKGRTPAWLLESTPWKRPRLTAARVLLKTLPEWENAGRTEPWRGSSG